MARKSLMAAVVIFFTSIVFQLVLFNSQTAFGGPFDKIGLKSPGASSSVSRNDLDKLYGLLSEADILLQNSLWATFRMLANKDEIQEMEAKLKAIENIPDPKERDAKRQEFREDLKAKVETALMRQETQKKVAEMSKEQRQLFANAIFNILLAGLMDKEAVEKAQQLSKAIQGNPTYAASFANDLGKIKDICTTLPPQIDKTVRIGNNLAKCAQSNKIEVALPKSAADKPQENSGSWMSGSTKPQ